MESELNSEHITLFVHNPKVHIIYVELEMDTEYLNAHFGDCEIIFMIVSLLVYVKALANPCC